MLAINTTEEDIDVEIPPHEIIPFDLCEFPGEPTSDSGLDDPTVNSQDPIEDYSERVRRVKDSLHVQHLRPEEQEQILRWANDYPDFFHLNGGKLSATHLIQYRIPTIDDNVMKNKQYRYSHDATERLLIQTEKQQKSGIMGESKSPYNSSLPIIPKKLDASRERKWRVVIDFSQL